MMIYEKINPHGTLLTKYKEPWVQGSKLTCSCEQVIFDIVNTRQLEE